MASKLLNVFNKIERGRQNIISKARLLGNIVPDNSSFTSLSQYISAPIDAVDTTSIRNEEAFEYPTGWPDLEEILNNAEDRGTLKPGAIFMIDASYGDTTTFGPQTSYESYQDSPRKTYCTTGASGYLLSDGDYVTCTDMNVHTHTWDTTQDIVVNTGEHQGTFRWFIAYFDPSKSAAANETSNRESYCVSYWPCVAIVVGNIVLQYPRIGYLFTTSIASTTEYLVHTLVYFKVLDTYQGIYYASRNSTNSWYLKVLEYLDLGPITKVNQYSSNSTTYFSFTSPALKELDFSNLVRLGVGNSITLNNVNVLTTHTAYKLQRIKCGETLLVNKISSSDSNYCLKEVTINNPEITTINITFGTFINPNLISNKIITGGAGSYADAIPSALIEYDPTKFQIATSSNGFFTTLTNFYNLEYGDFSLQTKPPITNQSSIYYSLSYTYPPTTYDVLSTTYYIKFGNGRLKTIIFPDDVNFRVCLAGVPVGKDTILDLFNKLHDITDNEVVYYPIIALSKIQYNLLTSEEKAIATGKGWEIIIV